MKTKRLTKRTQSGSDRLKRLNRGACPIHGVYMTQLDGWGVQPCRRWGRVMATVVECPRKDCGITAFYREEPRPEWLICKQHKAVMRGE